MITEPSNIGHVWTRSLRYFHLFNIWNNRTGGVCIVVTKAEQVGNMYVRLMQFSRCRKGDQYDKAEGRRIAQDKLLTKPIELFFDKPDWQEVVNYVYNEMDKCNYDHNEFGKRFELAYGRV